MTYKDEAKASRASKMQRYASGGAVDGPSQADTDRAATDQRANRNATSIRTIDPGKYWDKDKNTLDPVDTDFRNRQEDI